MTTPWTIGAMNEREVGECRQLKRLDYQQIISLPRATQPSSLQLHKKVSRLRKTANTAEAAPVRSCVVNSATCPLVIVTPSSLGALSSMESCANQPRGVSGKLHAESK